LVLDLTRAGSGWVAVGERGHVLLSDDGENWAQADFVPVQATLTRVTAQDGHMWAVGHDATIIHSHDGGQTWDLQLFLPELEQPFLDIYFEDRDNGFVIGAYGIFMVTNDGGESWRELNMADLVVSEAIDWDAVQARALAEDPNGLGFDRGCYEFMECHLNAFLDLGNDRYMIAAERGYGFRSVDGGQTWESFRFAYSGSMFGLIEVPNGILAYGLRGEVQLSTDFGSTWALLDSPTQSTLLGAAKDPDGTVLMVGSGAARLRYDPNTEQFNLTEDRLGNALASVVFAADGSAIYAGEEGVSHE
jgi:photosystem II stability/assembly factor-like uncharacterized protein